MKEIDFPDFYGNHPKEPNQELIDELIELGIARYREAFETPEVWDRYIIELEQANHQPRSQPNPSD